MVSALHTGSMVIKESTGQQLALPVGCAHEGSSTDVSMVLASGACLVRIAPPHLLHVACKCSVRVHEAACGAVWRGSLAVQPACTTPPETTGAGCLIVSGCCAGTTARSIAMTADQSVRPSQKSALQWSGTMRSFGHARVVETGLAMARVHQLATRSALDCALGRL